MPRNHDEAVEWPDEELPSVSEVLQRLELSEQLTQLEESNDREDTEDSRQPQPRSFRC